MKPVTDAPKYSFESERDYVKRLSGRSVVANPSNLTGQTPPKMVVREQRSRTRRSEIHSPVPRRSLSSPSNRDRFSSILSIDEGSRHSVLIGHNSGHSKPAAHIQLTHPGFDYITEVAVAKTDAGIEPEPTKGAEAMFSAAHELRSWNEVVSLQCAPTQ